VQQLRQVVGQHQRQLIQEQHQPMARRGIQPKLAQVGQVGQLIMLVLVLLEVMADFPVVAAAAVVAVLLLVVQAVMEQQER
jgi:hypothetical protein